MHDETQMILVNVHFLSQIEQTSAFYHFHSDQLLLDINSSRYKITSREINSTTPNMKGLKHEKPNIENEFSVLITSRGFHASSLADNMLLFVASANVHLPLFCAHKLSAKTNINSSTRSMSSLGETVIKLCA